MKLTLLAIFILILNLTHSQVVSVQDGNWNDAATWSSGVPSNNSNVEINHEVHIDVDDRCRSITINASGALCNDGFTLRVDRDWTNNGTFIDTLGTINFQSFFGGHTVSGNNDFNNVNITFKTINLTGSNTIRGVLSMGFLSTLNIGTGNLTLVATEDYHGRLGAATLASINGTFTSERYVGRCDGWSWYAGPFDASLADFAASSGGRMVYTGFPGSTVPSFSFVNAYFYDENWSSVGYTGYVVPSGVGDVVSQGTGFWYWNSDTVFSSGQASIPQMWKMSLTGSTDITNTFNFNVNYTNTGNAANDGWNFLGNPYPGTLDWDNAAWSQSGLDGALYTFNTCSQAYASYAGGIGTNGGTNLIPAWQGFHVKATGAPSLSVDASALVSTDADLKSVNLQDNILRVYLDGDEIVVRANDNASSNFDNGMDALKFSADYERLYTRIENKKQNYSINTVNDSSEYLPLYTKGNGTLTFSGSGTFESHYDLALEDLFTGQIYPINDGFEYPFTVNNTAEFLNRFRIHLFGGNSLGLDEKGIDDFHIRYDEEDLFIFSNSLQGKFQLELINMMGQLESKETIYLTKDGYRMRRPGKVMLIRLSNANGVYTKKIL